MSSLSARLLISVSVLLLLFFGATVVVLDTAFRTAGEQARRDILDGHLMQLLAAANPNDEGALSFPPDLHEERFNTIGSGLYGELRDDSGALAWRSRSALGLEIPQGGFPQLSTDTAEYRRFRGARGSGVAAHVLPRPGDGPSAQLMFLGVGCSCPWITLGT